MGSAEARVLLDHAAGLVLEYFRDVEGRPVAPDFAADSWLERYDFEMPTDPQKVLSEAVANLAHSGVHPTHPRYFGLFNPTPTWPGIAADLLTAAINPQLAAYSHAPTAVDIEQHVLRFISDRLGMPETTLGSFTSGGAEANHSATIIALTRRIPEYASEGLHGIPSRPVFYASAESHLAWLKIAHACGLGRDSVRLIPVDHEQRLLVSELRAAYQQDLAAGLLPFMLVATAGTTGAGAIDPLEELADFAAERGLHLHVDAAWAGAISLSDSSRALLAGIERADTVTVDAHKWMSVPMAAGMIFSRDADAVQRSFQVSTAYMPSRSSSGLDPYTTSMQWSRRLIGLKVFASLASFGRSGYAQQIEDDFALGRYVERCASEQGWVRVNATPLPVVCIVDPRADMLGPEESWEWHSAIAARVVASGAAWISPVRVAGRPALRICITSYRSTEADVDVLIGALDTARKSLPVMAPAREV